MSGKMIMHIASYPYLVILFLVGICLSFFPDYAHTRIPVQQSLGYKIYIQPVAIVQGEYVYLKDISRLDPTLPHTLSNSIQTLPLWKAPQRIGDTLVIPEIAIRKKLQEVLGKNAIFCQYPQTLTIQRGGKVVYRKEIEQHIKELLMPKLQNEYNSPVQIENMRIPEYILMTDPTGTWNIDIKRIAIPKVIMTLTILDSFGKKEQSIPLSVSYSVYMNALCAKEYLERNRVLDNAVENCSYNTSTITDLFINDIHRNYRAKKAIPKGAVILASDVELVPTIMKGATIDLVYNKNGILLSTKVAALTDAYIGESIKVQPSYSKKYIYATVRDEQTVVIQ